jgi:hypothetical protein
MICELARLTEAEAIAVAEQRWSCAAHRIPEATDRHPQYLFTRAPAVEAIGVAHYREIDFPFGGAAGIDFSPELWQRARFLACALAFVAIVNAPDGLFFATIKDFDKDAIAIRPRQLGIDSRAKFVVPRELFRALKPEGAKIGPGYRGEA